MKKMLTHDQEEVLRIENLVKSSRTRRRKNSKEERTDDDRMISNHSNPSYCDHGKVSWPPEIFHPFLSFSLVITFILS